MREAIKIFKKFN